MTELATTAANEPKHSPSEKKRRKQEEVTNALNSLPPSDFSILESREGYKISYKGLEFPFASPTLVGAIDLKMRVEMLVQVQETCKNIEWLKRECGFYTDHAYATTTGRSYQDLFINSGLILRQTTALTHERIGTIFKAPDTSVIMAKLSEYLNTISLQKDADNAQALAQVQMRKLSLAER